jgi:hypothetical protein
MVIIFNSTGCQLLSTGNVYIEQLMFGDILHLTTMTPTRIASTIYQRVTGFVLPSVDNHVHHFKWPPTPMQMFTIDAGVHCQIAATQEAHRPTFATGTHN